MLSNHTTTRDEQLRSPGLEVETMDVQLYGEPLGKTAKVQIFTKVHPRLIEMAKLVGSVFKSHGLQWFANGGTMLGAASTGAILVWDDDIDIGVKIEGPEDIERIGSTKADLAKMGLDLQRYEKYGWVISDMNGIPNESNAFKYPFIDVWHTTEHKDEAGRSRWTYDPIAAKEWPNEWFYDSELFPLRQVPFGTKKTGVVMMPVPADTGKESAALERFYPNWSEFGVVHCTDHANWKHKQGKLIKFVKPPPEADAVIAETPPQLRHSSAPGGDL